MRAALAIPSLAGVPVQMVANFGGSMASRLALDLVDEAMLDDAIAGGAPTPTKMAERALQRWWSTQLQDLQVLPRVALHVAEESRDETWAGAMHPGVWVYLAAIEGRNGIPRLALQPAVEPLERANPRLGTLAMNCLYTAQRLTAQVATPLFALHLASYNYWYGEDDEHQAVEELEAQGGSAEDLPLTRAQFDAAIPMWATKWRSRGLRVARPRDAKAQAVFDSCARIDAMERDPRFKVLGDLDAMRNGKSDARDSLDFAAIARWNAADPMAQVLDDWYQDVVSGDGYWEQHAAFPLDIDAGDFRKLLRALPAWTALYREMDALLALIGRPL